MKYMRAPALDARSRGGSMIPKLFLPTLRAGFFSFHSYPLPSVCCSPQVSCSPDIHADFRLDLME